MFPVRALGGVAEPSLRVLDGAQLCGLTWHTGRGAQTTRLWDSRIPSNGRSGTLLLNTELPYNKDIIILILQTR